MFLDALTEYVEQKVASYGAGIIMGAVAESPFGFALEVANRFSEFVETEGISELDKLASREIRKLENPLKYRFKGRSLLNKMQEVFSQPAGRTAAWKHSPWATSKEEWMADKWEHDWRSQPRVPAGSFQMVSTRRGQIKAGGEWTFGRLSYPFAGSPAIGKGKQRSSRNKRRLRRYRRYGRLAARDFVKAQDGG
jgi:hypothetical protein